MADEARAARCRGHLEAAAAAHRAAADALAPAVADATTVCQTTLSAGGTVLVCGNGGSAAESQHFAAELAGRFARERRAWPVVALTTDSSVLTAVGNDLGFSAVFARQVEALGRPGDTLVVLTTSGRSPNVIEAARRARDGRMQVVALTGADAGLLAPLADVVVAVPGTSAARVQEVHLTVLHAMCDEIEAALAHADGSAHAVDVTPWPEASRPTPERHA